MYRKQVDRIIETPLSVIEQLMSSESRQMICAQAKIIISTPKEISIFYFDDKLQKRQHFSSGRNQVGLLKSRTSRI